GYRFVNFGDRMSCKRCNCPKSSHFGGSPKESAPSFKATESLKLAMALEEIKQLKAPSSASALGSSTSSWWTLRRWADIVDEGDEALRSAAIAKKARLEAEAEQLRQALFLAKPKDVQLKSLADQIKKLEQQQEKGRGDLAAVELQQQELAAQATELRAADVERGARLVELKAEQARMVGRLAAPPAEPAAGLDGVVEVGGCKFTADFLGKVLGRFGVEGELHDALRAQATQHEQQHRAAKEAEAAAARAAAAEQRAAAAGPGAPADAPAAAPPGGSRAPIPGEGVSAGEDAMDDEGLDVEVQLKFCQAFGAAPSAGEGGVRPADDVVRDAFNRSALSTARRRPSGRALRPEGTVVAMTDDNFDLEAYYSTLYEADEQAALELGGFDFWGAGRQGQMPSQGGQAAQSPAPGWMAACEAAEAAGAPGGAALARARAGALLASGAGAALGCGEDGRLQTPAGLQGVVGLQGYGPRMSEWVDQARTPDWQPQGFSPSTPQPLPHKDSEFVAQQNIGDQVFGEFGSLEGAAPPRVPDATASASAAHLERLLAGKPKPMAKAGCCLATVNASSWGPLGEYLLRADGNSTLAIAVQEHHRLAKDLATQQRASKDAGWHGVWSAANPPSTSTSGSVGGVAVLAPTVVSVTAPPGCDSPVLVPGRLVAGHVRAGLAGGVVVLSIYRHDGEGRSGNNLGIIWQLAQYLGRLEAEGHHWAVMGDWSTGADELDFGWVGKLRAQVRQASGQSCRQGGGSNIDYFVVSKSLIPFTGEAHILDVGAHTWPHWPVRLPLCQVRVQAVQQVIDEPKPIPREAAKPGCARPPWRWGAFARCVDAVAAHAWAALAGWASELLKKQAYLAKLFGALKDHPVEEGAKPAAARAMCMCAIAKALVHFQHFLESLHGHGHWHHLPRWTRKPFLDDADFGNEARAQDLRRVLQAAEQGQRKQAKGDEARWKEWVDGAFLGGAGAAHAASKAPVLQEVLPDHPSEGAQALVARELQPWVDIWNYHGLTRMVHAVRDVVRSFPWRTGVGQSGIPPRALGDLSDDALLAMTAVFHKCEELLVWPSSRLINTMVRLPKPDGGCRLIWLMPTLVRVWSRARRPVTKARELDNPSELVWGTGPDRASSDSAYELNLAKEQAKLGGWDSAQAALDLWKAYEMVAPEGNIAGCGHANSLLMVLTLRALRKTHALAPSVTQRGLVDDVTLDWSGPKEADDDSLVTALSSFSVDMMKHWVRNLGHELHGRKVLRTQEKRRLQALAERRGRMAMLRRAAGRRAAALVATGLSPSAGHGAGVSGLAGKPLAQLRTLAAATAGAKAGCGTAAVMVLQRRVDFDPIYAATAPLVCRLASRIWGGRGSLAELAATWQVLAADARAGSLSWASVLGPLGATWLSLARIGWGMAAAWALRTDQGEVISLLRVAPRGVKDALVDGIQRWQCRRLAAHLPESGGEVLWPRAARAIARRSRPAAELGAVQALWAGGHFTMVWRSAHGFATTELCQACGQAKDTLMHRWCACHEVMRPRDEELEQEEPFRKPIAAMHTQMAEAEQKWTIGDSELPLAYGLPLLPALPPPAPAASVTFEWGAAQVAWPAVVYTDGSGHASQVHGARRCGWAAVALRPDGMPLKAAYGPLPGPRQTVGRAERQACLAPLSQAGEVQLIVSDLQSLVTEGNLWSPTAQAASARHASTWRQLHAAAEERGSPPPRFRWAPAHSTLEQALEEGIGPMDWLGNCWADFFANLGAAETRLPNNTVEALKAELQRALDTATYLGWAAARVCQLDLWRPLGDDGELQRRAELKCPAPPKLSLTRHEYQAISARGVQRLHCGREAHTEKARSLLDCRPCQPSALGRLRAARSREVGGAQLLASSAMVDAGLQAAALCEAEQVGHSSAAPEVGQAFGPTEGGATGNEFERKAQYLLAAAKGNSACVAGHDLLAIATWERAGPLEATLCTLASSWITDLLDQSLAYASWMEECVDYVYRLLGEAAFRSFFAYTTTPESRSAERLRKARGFCERGWRDGSPCRETRIDEALQLEGGLRDARAQRLRCYHWAARAYLSGRGNARHAGGRQGHLYGHWPPEALPGPNGLPSADGGDHGAEGDHWEDFDDADMEVIRGLTAQDVQAARQRVAERERAATTKDPSAQRVRGLTPPRGAAAARARLPTVRARRQAERARRLEVRAPARLAAQRKLIDAADSPAKLASRLRVRRRRRVGPSSSDSNATGLGDLRRTLQGFAGCWVFDLRDPDGAGVAWLAWAAQYVLEWLARPGNAAEREEAIQRAGSIGLRALVHALVRQAWTMKASVRRAAVGHLLGLSTLEEWMHVAALQWATVDEIMCTIRGIVGEAAANLPAPPGFAGPIPGLGPVGVREPPRSARLPRPVGLSVLGGYLAVRQPWRNPQLPLLQQRGLDASDDDDVAPHPGAAPSGLPPPPLAAAAVSGGQPPEPGVGNHRRWQVETATQGSDSSEGPSLGGNPAVAAAINGMPPWHLMGAGDAGGDGAAAGLAPWEPDGAAGDADGSAAEGARAWRPPARSSLRSGGGGGSGAWPGQQLRWGSGGTGASEVQEPASWGPRQAAAGR
ncbi:unnamed protein product, partial [Prorocentrum cordatum]